ncbi:hypothetical protein ACN47E_005924 [Coniothyrium glycines]
MANFRPLQPAPMDQEPPQQRHSRQPLAQKPKRTVTLGACVACRKRKSKCDGVRPNCTCCVQKDTDCVYELGPNEKPSQAMKRKNEEMQGELSNLRQLYDFLRLRPEDEAMTILKRIRDSPPDTSPSQRIQELADFVRHGDLLLPQHPQHSPRMYDHDPTQLTLPSLRIALDSPSNLDSHHLPFPGIMSIGVEGPVTQRRRFTSDANVSACSGSQSPPPPPTSIKAIVHRSSISISSDSTLDPRLSHVTKWTNVTADADLLIRLLSDWTEYEYSYYHYLDRESFLEDLSSGRTVFCSSLLVNALLASACFHCSAIADRHKPFLETSMTTRFYKEALRLWDLETEQDSLTRLQAGICLFLVLGKYGRDKVGQNYLLQACQIGDRLGLFDKTAKLSNSLHYNVRQEQWNEVRAVTAWSLFNFQLQMSAIYSSPVLIGRPPALTIPYHHQPETEALFRSECMKHMIILDCIATRQDDASPGLALPQRKAVESCYDRLTAWWHRRDSSIQPERAPSKENLLCAMLYHVDLINLYRAVVNSDPTDDWNSSHIHHARCVTSSSLKAIRKFLALQEQRHGWTGAITLVLHPITVVSFGSLEEITTANVDLHSVSLQCSEPYLGLLTCLRALSSLSQYSYYAQPLFRLLTQKCLTLGLPVPVGIQNLLEYYMSEEWTRTAALSVSSQYIADKPKTASDEENASMDAVISGWESLSFNGAEKGKARAECLG